MRPVESLRCGTSKIHWWALKGHILSTVPTRFTPVNSELRAALRATYTPATISADAHEVTADYLASLKIANLRPFVLAGAGLLFNEPVSGQANATSSNKPVAVYGAGLDWGLLPHIGVRLQYRGNLYKAPDLTKAFSSTGAFTHTAEPMIGIYLRL
jgi:opacity protein-like surface antigen